MTQFDTLWNNFLSLFFICRVFTRYLLRCLRSADAEIKNGQKIIRRRAQMATIAKSRNRKISDLQFRMEPRQRRQSMVHRQKVQIFGPIHKKLFKKIFPCFSGGINREWAGVPRKLFKPGSSQSRCACVKDSGPSQESADPQGDRGDLDHPNLQEYDNCDPKAVSCNLPPDSYQWTVCTGTKIRTCYTNLCSNF